MKRSADYLNEEEDEFAWIPSFTSRPERQPPPAPPTPEFSGKLASWRSPDDEPGVILAYIRLRLRLMDLPPPIWRLPRPA